MSARLHRYRHPEWRRRARRWLRQPSTTPDRRRTIAAGVLVALVAATASVPVVADAPADQPTVLGIGLRSGLPTANISQSTVVDVAELATLQYRGLTGYSDDTLDIVPDLATSWTISDDFTEITYVLDDDLIWSDGTALTADDVVYTIERSAAETWPSHATFTRSLTAEATDAQTVIVRSDGPDPTFPSLPVAIVPAHVFSGFETAAELAAWDGLPAVGSGPYLVDDFTPGEGWTMQANPSWPDWPSAGASIDTLQFVFLESENSAVGLLERGVLDIVNDVPAAFFERLDAGIDIDAVAGFTSAFEELGLNNGASGLGDGHPALTDQRVRQALVHAIDRGELTRSALQGLGIPAATAPFSTLPMWRPTFDDAELFGYDTARSTTLLAEAGYVDTDGDGIVEDADGAPLVLRLAQRSDSALEPFVTNSIAASLLAIGVDTTISVLSDTDLLDRLVAGEFDLYVWRRAPINDPGRTPFFFLCAQVPTAGGTNQFNTTNYCNPAFDDLYEQQRVEVDVTRRQEIVAEMIKLLHDDVATITLFEDATLQAYRIDEFEGWTQQPAVLGTVIFNESARTYTNLRPLPPSSFSGSDLLGGGAVLTDSAGADNRVDDADDAGDSTGASTADGDDPNGAGLLPIDDGRDPLWPVAIAVAAVAGLIALLWWWRRRRRDDSSSTGGDSAGGSLAPPSGPPLDPPAPPPGTQLPPPGAQLPPPTL